MTPLAAKSNAHPHLDRRGFFNRVANGLQGASLAYLLNRDLYGANTLLAEETDPLGANLHRVGDTRPRRSHHEPRAKAVIQLFMNGGPSQMDLFDPKPILNKLHGQPHPHHITTDLSSPQKAGALLGSPFKFAQHGQSGIWLSDALPHLARQVDNLSVIRSMFTTHPNHEPALYKIHSGRTIPGRPVMGAWITYGLGSENQNLPAYVVLDDPKVLPINEIRNWQSGFLPPIYGGTRVRSTGSPILNLHAESEYPAEIVTLQRNLLRNLDDIHRNQRPGMLQLDARVSSYELAARMQLEAGDALDINQESKSTLQAYGVGNSVTDSYARRCIMARRLVERGVRFVQVFIYNQIWDSHADLEREIRTACNYTDKPVAALLADLKQRGLLDQTLVLWGGEFGRLPIAEHKSETVMGRDHGPRGFSLWMAGGGVKPGVTYGATDELGYAAVENPVSVADWHATILHLLGLHHEKLFFERNGLQEKLTDTFKSRIVREIIA